MCMNFYFLETWRKNYCLCNVSVSSYFVVLATKNIFPCTCIDIKKNVEIHVPFVCSVLLHYHDSS